MSRGNPENSILTEDTHHLICPTCGGPAHHDDMVHQLLVKSIDEVRSLHADPNMKGVDLFYASRGYERPPEGGSTLDAAQLPIDPMHQRAIDEARQGLSQYPITGSNLQFRDGQGGHVMHGIYLNQTGKPHNGPRDILNFIRESKIKGINTTTLDSQGGMSNPGKMWGGSEDHPTAACNVGAAMRKQPGSPCYGCYVDFGRQNQAGAQRIQWANLMGLANPNMYAAALSYQIENHSQGDRLRFFSGGDLQSPNHLAMLVDIAKQHPEKMFWLPTREIGHVGKYLDANKTADGLHTVPIPENLTLRLSSPKGDLSHQLTQHMAESHPQITMSTMNASHQNHEEVWVCPSAGHKDEKGTCEHWGCDACWNPSIRHIDYSGHSVKRAYKNRSPGEQMLHQSEVDNTLKRLEQVKGARPKSNTEFDISQFTL